MNTSAAVRAPALERLLGGMPVAEFLTDHWLTRPLVRRAGAQGVVALATLQKVEHWVSDTSCDLLCVRDGQAVVGGQERTVEATRRLLSQGVSLALRHPDQHDAELATLGRALAGELFGMLNLHVYCTPAGHGSFGWHHDPEEVFIVQTEGTKRYVVRENTVRRWPLEEALGGPGELAKEASEPLEVELSAGDVLYIPGGWWHTTQAITLSVSLSVGLLLPSAVALLDFLRADFSQHARWRRRIGGLGHASFLDDAERVATCRQGLVELSDALRAAATRPDTALRFMAGWWMAGLSRSR